MTKPLVSIVVICKNLTDFFVTKTYPAITGQSYNNWELLILPDNRIKFDHKSRTKIIPTWPKVGPAAKKDIGIQMAKGDIVAFIDDDAYPDKDWLANTLPYFSDQTITAVCGPGVTPPGDSLLDQVSGWFWASPLGSGGAGTYRCWPGKIREVDDYPTFNLIGRKSDLNKIEGFDSSYWPGEDTKLCHDLVYKLNKKIIYDPKVIVYHHRRPILIPHLKQLGRYGLHRGYFARVLPKTSRRMGYFMPSVFALGIICGLLAMVLSGFIQSPILNLIVSLFWICFCVYTLVNFLNAIWVLIKGKSVLITLLLVPVTFISHVFYGMMFIRGLMLTSLVSKYDRNRL